MLRFRMRDSAKRSYRRLSNKVSAIVAEHENSNCVNWQYYIKMRITRGTNIHETSTLTESDNERNLK